MAMDESDLFPYRIPEAVVAIGKSIERAGGRAYIVGGWVRDRLMGYECHDLDLATDLEVPSIREAVSGHGTVYELGARFGTVGLRTDDLTVEITTFRSERYEPGSRHPEVEPASSIEEDLSRRDFTMNALAVSLVPEPGRIIDPYGGRGDIERGLIRTPGPPLPLMRDDPLRMLRAVRFSSQLGFEIDAELMDTLSANPGLLEDISWERRRQELERTLVTGMPDAGILKMVETGMMDFVAPEVSAMKGVEQPPRCHRADVLEHTLLTVSYIRPEPLLRRAALFHDLGKPHAKVTEPRVMFPDHEKTGEEICRRIMKRLRYSNSETRATAFLVRKHMRPILYTGEWTDNAVRRFMRDCTLERNGKVLVPLDYVFELARADIEAGSLERAPAFMSGLEELRNRVEEQAAELPSEPDLSPLDGNDLMEAFGRGPGPWLRGVKEMLADKVYAGELEPGDREGALEAAREYLETAEPQAGDGAPGRG